MAKSDDDAIAAYIARHGVTKCPPGVAAPTTAAIAQEAAQAHRERGIGVAGNAKGVRGKIGWARYWESTHGKARRKNHD